MNSLLEEECGDPSVSYENACKMTINGPIVAVTHIITPTDNHITKLFYQNGSSLLCRGFTMGLSGNLNKTDTQKREATTIALMMVIQTMWGFAPVFDSEKFFKLGIDAKCKKTFNENKSMVYCFLSPEKTTPKYISESNGMLSFNQSLSFLKDNPNNNIIYIGSSDEL